MASKAELALILSLVDDVSKTAKNVRGELKGIGTEAGGLQGMLTQVGKVGLVAVAAGAAAATAAIAAGAKAAWDAAMAMDSAMDTIAIGTGASTERLEELRTVLEDVASNTHTGATIDVISGALTALDAKLEASDEDLYNLTLGITELSQMTGGDAKKNADAFARTLGDWAVPAEEGKAVLDKMFVATQQSGIGFDRLSELMVQFGAPLRNMDFTMEDSIALLSKWEKEGVNTELVMGSLRIAAGKFAKDGKPLRKSLFETFEAIQNMTDGSEALALGMEVFGARAGPDMTAAIREGRFAIDDMVAMMGDAQGAIEDTARATEDWPEKLQRAKNKIIVAIAPIGEGFTSLAGKLLDRAGPALDQAAGWITENVVPAFDKLGGGIDTFFSSLDQGRGPVEAFKDTLWTLLPPGVAADLTGAITKIQELAADIKAGDWGAVGASLWEMIQTGFEAAVTFGAELAELARRKLATALGLSTSHDAGAGSDNTTWATIGLTIGQSIVNGVRNFFATTVAQLTEASQNFLRWSEQDSTQEDLRLVGANLSDALMEGFTSGVSSGLIEWRGWPKAEEIPLLNWLRGIGNVIAGVGRGIPAMGDLKFDTSTPGNAAGTDFWRGGPTWVGERGPEIVVPPRGSQILSADQSKAAGGNTYVTIAAGAIVVHAPNAEAAGIGVLTQLRALGVGV